MCVPKPRCVDVHNCFLRKRISLNIGICISRIMYHHWFTKMMPGRKKIISYSLHTYFHVATNESMNNDYWEWGIWFSCGSAFLRTINPTEFQLSSCDEVELPTICQDIYDWWFIEAHIGIAELFTLLIRKKIQISTSHVYNGRPGILCHGRHI